MRLLEDAPRVGRPESVDLAIHQHDEVKTRAEVGLAEIGFDVATIRASLQRSER